MDPPQSQQHEHGTSPRMPRKFKTEELGPGGSLLCAFCAGMCYLFKNKRNLKSERRPKYREGRERVDSFLCLAEPSRGKPGTPRGASTCR